MQVKVDGKKNRLYLKISGNVSKKELENLYTDIRFAVADLQPGFSLVNDLTECKLCHITGIGTYKKISNYLVTNGVRDVVRIINHDSLVLKQILNFASRYTEYIPIYVSTTQEAEEQLDMSDQTSRLRFRFSNLPPVEYFFKGTKGEGRVYHIATSGCRIDSATIAPVINEQLDITFAFNAPENDPKNFYVKAQVVESANDEFAVEHRDFSDGEESRLWQYLLHEFKHESQNFHSHGFLL
jgi:PilZ domain